MPNDVSTQRQEVTDAVSRGQLVRDLVGGTPAMRAAGELYIPRGSVESLADHKARVNGAVLLNGYKRTRDYLAGQVFARDVVLEVEDGTPTAEQFAPIAEDIDAEGTNLSTWAQKLFKQGLDAGAAFILVDFSRVETRTGEGGRMEYLDAETGRWLPKTREADAKNGWRPYWVAIELSQVLGWRMEYRGGKRVLTQFRFKEAVREEAGSYDTDDETVEQVRVLTPGRYEIWRKVEGEKEDQWRLHDEGKTTLQVIPLAFWMPGEVTSDLTAYPALEDLAHLNLRHWQATADQVDLMSWVRRPAWFGKLLTNDEGGQIAFGPARLVHANSPEADLRSVGVDAASVEAGRNELTDLEERMALYGLQLLMPRTGTVTATESSLGKAESSSTLKSWAMSFKDCIEQALVFTAQWLEVEQAPGVSVNTEFHALSAFDPAVILKAVEQGVLPRQMAFDEFRRRGLIRDDAEWTEAQALLEAESRAGVGPSMDAADAARRLLGQAAPTGQQ